MTNEYLMYFCKFLFYIRLVFLDILTTSRKTLLRNLSCVQIIYNCSFALISSKTKIGEFISTVPFS